MDRSEVFTSYRPLLFSIAYRMLGTVMDAEDILQETFLRWQQSSTENVENPRAFLSAVVTRLCIDQLRSARRQREEYIGPWLPEPFIANEPSQLDSVIMSESLSMAFLVLLEKLNPVERAVYLLHEVFDYDYAEIAYIVGKSEENCRQLFSRAKKYIVERRPRFQTNSEQDQRLLLQFQRALSDGDMNGLLETLAEDIVLYSDGGGKVTAARNPVRGSKKVAQFFLGIAKKAPPGLEVRFALVNGLPGCVNYFNNSPLNVFAFQIIDGRIQNIFGVSNPEKLKRIKP